MWAFVLLLVAGLAPVPASAAPATVTWYMHGQLPAGNPDEYVNNGEEALAPGAPPRVWMDENAPTLPAPKVTTIAAAPYHADSPRGVTSAFWIGRVRGTVSDVSVTVWTQSADPGGAVRISLYADVPEGQSGTGIEPVARANVATPGPEPAPVTVTFPDVEIFVAATLRAHVYPAGDTELAVYYDSLVTPSQMTFNVDPTPLQGSGAVAPGLGRVTYTGDGACAAGDALCHRALSLKAESQVVIAIVDTGFNAYHSAFRREGMDVHPSEYVSGYPSDPAAVVVTRDAPYEVARFADEGRVWSKLEQRKLYWFPGTNVIGAISFGEENHGVGRRDPWPIIDDSSHGTMTSSVAAGGIRRDGSSFGTNPDALLVIVEGMGHEAVEWVRSQPWIDLMSLSFGNPFGLPVTFPVSLPNASGPERTGEEFMHTRRFVLEDGRTACSAAGNGIEGLVPVSSITSTGGPSWMITVGGANPENDQAYEWHSRPVDVIANAAPTAADPFSADGERGGLHGTSFSSPIACGVLSRVLLEARRALGDIGEGVHEFGLGPAVGSPIPGSPALSDGILTRTELESTVLRTAEPIPFDPASLGSDPQIIPTAPGYYVSQGYGVVDTASGQRAIDVLLGSRPLPDRSDVDAWIATADRLRDIVYPPSAEDPAA
jgi:hypothetical protein